MRALGRGAALAVLVTFSAYAAEDAPKMERVAPGFVTTVPGYFLNEPGYVKLKSKTDKLQRDLIAKDAELLSLQKRTDAAGGVPLWAVGVGLSVSFLLGAGVVALTKK